MRFLILAGLSCSAAVGWMSFLPQDAQDSEKPKQNRKQRRQIDEKAITAEVQKVLDTQVAAWNNADLEGFMKGYVRNEKLRFASGDNVRRGWKKALESYKRGYATPEAMGKLAFVDLEFQVISRRWVEVFGRYKLQRSGEHNNATGLFTLLVQRGRGGQWKILHDHTSAAEKKSAATPKESDARDAPASDG